MLKSPWMLLVVVPVGFLLLAGVAASQLGEWTYLSTAFVVCAFLSFCIGAPFVFAPVWTSVASRSKISRFAQDWLQWYPETTENELRRALRRRFRGSATDTLFDDALDQTVEGSAIEEWFLSTLLLGPVAAFRHRFFPEAPADPADIEAVLAELQAEGRLAAESKSET